jgi:hypothetical protein
MVFAVFLTMVYAAMSVQAETLTPSPMFKLLMASASALISAVRSAIQGLLVICILLNGGAAAPCFNTTALGAENFAVNIFFYRMTFFGMKKEFDIIVSFR